MKSNKTLLQPLCKEIILEFSKKTVKNLEVSMGYLYTSETYKLISEVVSDMSCKGHVCLVQELIL
ncbi:TPA: hypothetical protein KMZ56_002307 [Clostridioides difficile]|uniref:hypothetical protein n=1 Tax=Clostridioides difficile TaxID=1496 RepID=UPI001C137F37|nr:hypothetical protein [Clostridioides difficile]MCP8333100.1 hypothetical protein [Clostridioides difficile]HBE7905297.1 hypothetical protein [Clostridioides difficile]HBF5147700.1 hypothetical protein [Clostridioides difficile]HBG1639011.1 hypothetical protein [Clostridioides difficile]HBH3440913.1 hypothetical protein [Clostridioides difficile]